MSQIMFKCGCGTIFVKLDPPNGLAECPSCKNALPVVEGAKAYLDHLRNLVAKEQA